LLHSISVRTSIGALHASGQMILPVFHRPFRPRLHNPGIVNGHVHCHACDHHASGQLLMVDSLARIEIAIIRLLWLEWLAQRKRVRGSLA
jgi:hypothetical protein